ncbi:hypothetical protein A8F94_08110 [Bacillus sp. FJAT-27225]|uniref:DUF2628 domain-containing protein n=1 Tax=Bacillus sp. FJAT-27225 TaxID=1743144 RepID=UPI00080C312E|nr:DUF2628 domain-containing protein [Bacillus sp. FJAT-27225]OCA87797.1 hypothetical protein A8F94_08110 [Bacillus sp. FJAT-27225]
MFCTNCGAKIGEGGRFCPSCGKAVDSPATEISPSTSGPVSETEELETFVGKKSDYYLRKWSKPKGKSGLMGWNWAAFFAGMFWLGYRKMYKIVLIILGAFLAFDIISLIIDNPILDQMNYSIGMVTAALLGMQGNYYYHKTAQDKIKDVKKQFPDNSAGQLDALRKQGGASWGGVFIVLGLFVGYLVINVAMAYVFDSTAQDSISKDKPEAVVASNNTDTTDKDNSADTPEETDNSGSSEGTNTGTANQTEEDTSSNSQDTYSDASSLAEVQELLNSYMDETGLAMKAIDVQYDMANQLDREFAIIGTASLSDYYNYGFSELEKEFFAVKIYPLEDSSSIKDVWTLYFNRTDFAELFNTLKVNGETILVGTGVIPSQLYEDSQGNLAIASQASWAE